MRGSPGGKKSARVFQTFQIPASAPSSASASGGGGGVWRGASPGRGGDFLGRGRQERIRLGARGGGSERGRMAAEPLAAGCEGCPGACPAHLLHPPPPARSFPRLQIPQKLLSCGPSVSRSLKTCSRGLFQKGHKTGLFLCPAHIIFVEASILLLHALN